MKRGKKPGSVVYLVQAGGEGGPIKIGWADNFKKRFTDIQCCNHEKVAVLATFAGGLPEEQMAHRVLGEFRIRGEWFRPAKPVLQLVEIAKELPGQTGAALSQALQEFDARRDEALREFRRKSEIITIKSEIEQAKEALRGILTEDAIKNVVAITQTTPSLRA